MAIKSVLKRAKRVKKPEIAGNSTRGGSIGSGHGAIGGGVGGGH